MLRRSNAAQAAPASKDAALKWFKSSTRSNAVRSIDQSSPEALKKAVLM
jgi:hypothetical protein